jgi:hypothetical protein
MSTFDEDIPERYIVTLHSRMDWSVLDRTAQQRLYQIA